MTKLPRAERHYVVTKGQLTREFRAYPQNKGQPYSRPVLESGTAVKTIYISKAPMDMTSEQLEKALDRHETIMRKEITSTGRIVRKVIKTLHGLEGDVRFQMVWEVLGVKNTKKVRRNHARMGTTYASALEPVEGSQAEPGRVEAQAGNEEGPVQI